jgi:hypothetical protein
MSYWKEAIIVNIFSLINIVNLNKSNIKVELSVIIVIVLVLNTLYRIIIVLIIRVISPNNRLFIN